MVPFRVRGLPVDVFMATDRKQGCGQQGTKGMTGLPLLSREDRPALRRVPQEDRRVSLGRQGLLIPKISSSAGPGTQSS